MKAIFKNTVSVVLLISILFCLSACGKEKGNTAAENEQTATAAPVQEAAATSMPLEPENADPVDLPEETPAPTDEEDTPEATPTPEVEETLKIQYEEKPAENLTFMTSTVFQLRAVTNSLETGGTWTSSDAAVASVDENGIVTCWKTGSAKITFTLGSLTASCNLTVNEPTISICYGNQVKTDISLSNAWGYEIQLNAVVSPAGSTVTWSSEDPTIASVSETGLVKGLRGGNTTIYCKCGTAKAACIIRVLGTPPTQAFQEAVSTPEPNDTAPHVIITYAGFKNTDFTSAVGTSIDLNYVLYNLDPNTPVTWSIDNNYIATVNADGVVTCVSVGTTTVKCTAGETTAECIVRVVKAQG